jgi:uncharacterized protein YkwD
MAVLDRMKAKHLVLCAAAVFAACSTAPPAPSPAPATATVEIAVPEYAKIEREVMHFVNVERVKNHVDTLIFNPSLEKAAAVQAVQMAARRKMAHELPGAEYPTLGDRIRYAGYVYRRLTENIAYGYPTAANAVAAWMTSPGHRQNILDRGVRETAVGVARAKTGELYYCEVFGARRY